MKAKAWLLVGQMCGATMSIFGEFSLKFCPEKYDYSWIILWMIATLPTSQNPSKENTGTPGA
jgi:hypothetical protein